MRVRHYELGNERPLPEWPYVYLKLTLLAGQFHSFINCLGEGIHNVGNLMDGYPVDARIGTHVVYDFAAFHFFP